MSTSLDGIEARAVPDGVRPWGLAHSQFTHFHESDFLFALHGRQLMQQVLDAPVRRAESGNSLQGWEVDETIEERSGQVNFGCLYNAKEVSPWVAECSSPF
jgi:hypothetical protein